MAEKIAVYICEGCDIGQHVDVEAIVDKVSNKFGDLCPVVKNLPVACGNAAIKEIKADLEENDLDGCCICACSPRQKWDIFRFDDTIVERVNLREQCVWSFKDGNDGVEGNLQKMAEDYVKMGVAKLKNTRVPAPELTEMSRTILVVGGGFTGMNSALNATKAGYDVVLIEKEAELGGRVANMYKTVPLTHPYAEIQDTGIEKLVEAVMADQKITVKTCTTLEHLKGAPGTYKAVLKTGSGEETVPVGACVMATGWQPQDTAILEPLGYGRVKNVVTAAEFEQMAKKGEILRPSDGSPAKKVAFILNGSKALPKTADMYAGPDECVTCETEPAPTGNEEAEIKVVEQKDLEAPQHLPYSKAVNTMVALKQARYVREKFDDGLSYIFYDHMIVPGIHEKFYKVAQDEPGMMLTKADIVDVVEDADGGVLVSLENTLFGESIEVKVDLVVLPTGIVPATAKNPIMNFEYRQGPAFPDLELFDGFADSNYICFPYETRRTGVYAAGCVRQPMLMDACQDDAAGAALKAIQCITSINRGASVHPRSGDTSYPVFNFVRCTQCKRCTEECPFGALDDDEKGTPLPNPTRCRRCGTCMGACPERVISFDNYSVGMVGEMIRQFDVPDDMVAGGPRVLILACENDAYPALDMAAFRGKRWNPYVRIIPVRCLGSVNAIWVADAMSRGTDGVMMLGCKYGDNYQCHFVKGSELCNRRKENIAETLGRLGIEADRVEQYQVAIDEYDRIPEIIDEFMAMIMEKGPNPFKGY